VIDDNIKKKIEQAEFHLAKLREAESPIAVESHLSAFMTAARSVVMYVHEWQLANHRAAHKKDWSRINAWEATLAPADHDGWRAVAELRNMDVHEVPVVPVKAWMSGWTGAWMGGWTGRWLGANPTQTVTHPTTGDLLRVIEIAEATLRVVKRLRADYKTI